MMMQIKTWMRGFARDTRGTVAVEAAVIFPVVMWAFLAMFVYFEGYRQASVNHKAANTIADMYSRETENITNTYIDNTRDLFELLASANEGVKIRVSVIKWAKRKDEYRVVWSRTRGAGISKLEHADITEWETKLPVVPNQERIVLVETWSTYNPLFRIGMDPTEIKTFVFTRLRFAPQLKFSAT